MHEKFAQAVLAAASLVLLAAPGSALASASITAATGGSSISADTAGGSFTGLAGPTISEGAVGDIGTSTIVLNAPSGFEFSTTTHGVTVTRTNPGTCSGQGNNVLKLSATGNGGSPSVNVTPATSSITVYVTQASAGNASLCAATLTWSGIAVRPTNGMPLASGNITKSGGSVIAGVTNGSTNFGALVEVAGAASKLAFTTQPGDAAYGSALSAQPVVKTQDQFGNTSTTGLAASKTVTLSVSSGAGSLQGTASLDIGTGTGNGTAAFSGLKVDTAGAGKRLTAAASGLTSAVSDSFTISQSPLTVSGVTAHNKVYDGTTTATLNIGSAALVGVVGADDVALDATGTSASFADKNVRTGKTVNTSGFALTGTAAGNYTLTQPTATANITPVALAVSADNKTKHFGGADPAFTSTTTAGSLIGGDLFSGALARDPGENPGTYAITQGTLSAGSNYSITFTPGTLTILNSMSFSTSVNTDGSLSATTTGSISATATSSGVSTTVDVPAGTVITGGSSWNGVLDLPEATTTFAAPSDSGFTDTVQSAIAIGAGDTPLTFDKGVRLRFAGQAGKLVGWSRSGTFHSITTACADNTQATNDGLASGADCKIANDGGGNLVVWTKHFTAFVVYTQTANPAPPVPAPAPAGGNGPIVGTFGLGQVLGASATGGQVLGAASSTVPSTSAYTFTRGLSFGARGQDVTELQKILITGGFLKIAAPTGYFGPLTRAAVKAFQKAHGIAQTGTVGPKTRAALNAGAPTADFISTLQQKLQNLLAQIKALQGAH